MIFSDLPKPLFILAPMEDVTDIAFRQLVAECAPPDLSFTEFINVDGLMSPGRKRLIHKLRKSDSEPPLIAHIWGINPDNFLKISEQISSGQIADELGMKDNFIGIDLNMGCPVKKVVKAGACSALINDHKLALEIINATKSGAGKLPVSIKTRLGFKQIDPSWSTFLLKQKPGMLTVHARTVKEMSEVPAHHEEFKRIIKERDELSKDTLIIGNGDISNRMHGEKLIKKYGLDGVMIGRGIFHDPFAFSPNSPWHTYSKQQKVELFKRHIDLFNIYGLKAFKQLNRFAEVYLNGFDDAKVLREAVSSATDISEMSVILSRELA